MSGLGALLLVAVTSAAACWFGARVLRLSISRLPAAIGSLCETLGVVLAFLILDVALGVFVALAARAFAVGFLSVYFVADARLPVLALLQGIAFQAWRSAR